ncbi:MAG: SpoVR family protein [Bacillota bacterium]
MPDYALTDLVQWGEKIEEMAADEGLRFFPQEFEICNYEDMLCYEAYSGMPSHYPHWSYGKSYERLKTFYQYNIIGLPYEMVINSNPCLAYLMKDNTLLLQILTMAHVYAHNDFFRNNHLFAERTRAELTIGMFKNHADRIRAYISDPSIGCQKVEKILNAAHALCYQTIRFAGAPHGSYDGRRPVKAREKRVYSSEHPLLDNRDTDSTEAPSKILSEPEEDLLWFLGEYGNLEDWEKDLLNIVREETLYFIPQIETKIMNEGWASFWHYRLLTRMELPEKLQWEFIKRHNQVVRPLLGGLNPYHLGFVIFTCLFRQYGADKIFEARETEKDQTFLWRYLTREICEELHLLQYAKEKEEYVVREISDDEGWIAIRDMLARRTGMGGIPVIRLMEYLPLERQVTLVHEYDGRDLEMNYATETLRYFAELWKGRVTFKTKLRQEERIIHCDEKMTLTVIK